MVKNQTKKQATRKHGMLSTLGGIAGAYLGGPLGGVLGSKAGDLLSKITGFGGYKVNSNTLIDGNSVPSFRLVSDGIEIAHREFISDVTIQAGFSNTGLVGQYPINPGLKPSFPWLSTIAQNFEEYQMLGLVYEYRPSSGSAVATTSAALGTVIYATDYNVQSPAFTSKQQMESYEFSCSTVPFEGMLHPVECKPGSETLTTRYIRTGSVPAGGDPKMFDLGLFQVGSVGAQSTYTCGELWVSYHLRLKRPRINNKQTNGSYAHCVEFVPTTCTAAHPLGMGGFQVQSDSTLLGVSPISGTAFQLANPGRYYLSFTWSAATAIAAAPTVSLGSSIVSSSVDGDFVLSDSTAGSVASFNSGGTIAQLDLVVNVLSASLNISNNITIGGLTSMSAGDLDLWIFPLPDIIN
jgi:hypothetical protein